MDLRPALFCFTRHVSRHDASHTKSLSHDTRLIIDQSVNAVNIGS